MIPPETERRQETPVRALPAGGRRVRARWPLLDARTHSLQPVRRRGLRSEIVSLERKRGEGFPKWVAELKAGSPVKISQ